MLLKKITSFFQKKNTHQFPEFSAIFLSCFATIELSALLSFSYSFPEKNILGLFGYSTAAFWYFFFGPTSFLGVSYLYLLAWNWWNKKYHSSPSVHIASYLGTLFSLCLILQLLVALFPELNQTWCELIGISNSVQKFYPSSNYFHFSGFIADFLYRKIPYGNFEILFNLIGTAFIASTSLFISLILLFDIDIKLVTQSLLQFKKKEESPQPLTKSSTIQVAERKKAPQSITSESSIKKSVNYEEKGKESGRFEEEKKREIEERSTIKVAKQQNSPDKTSIKKIDFNDLPTEISEDFTHYQLPSLDLFENAKKIDNEDVENELKEKAVLLEETLLSFGIEAKVGQIHCGPTVTLFEVHPAVGVKIGKIKALENDIALNMEAKSIRIIAPIPGKAAVGIEIPNQIAQTVLFQELLQAYLEKNLSYKIPMLLGKAVNGDWIITDLSKMPHCIIAGATGSGKSVCINSIVMSILMLARPDEIRLLMIDPKKVELTPYTNLPHMIAPVITEPHEAALSLNWLVHEMEKRYEILKLLGLRNIDGFNKRIRDTTREERLPIDIPDKFPYYVGIIDELADLMMVSSQDIETPIARIAQMARAVGIHLILATQRPSREVITGLIKANFPARISFKVASRVNSQIILDDTGAETLLGNGDMLLSLPGTSQLLRCQGVFVRDDEIIKIIETIEKKYPTNYLIKSFQKTHELDSEQDITDIDSLDSRYQEAKDIVLSTGNASTTFLQRKLKIGYARAASIMDQLEDQGVIGPQEGAKPRKIFFPKKMDEEIEPDDLLLHQEKASFINEEQFTPPDNLSILSSETQNRFQLLRDISQETSQVSATKYFSPLHKEDDLEIENEELSE